MYTDISIGQIYCSEQKSASW